jgi:hypothetical protein
MEQDNISEWPAQATILKLSAFDLSSFEIFSLSAAKKRGTAFPPLKGA